MKNIVRLKIKELEMQIFDFYQKVYRQNQLVLTLFQNQDKNLLTDIIKNEQKINRDYHVMFEDTVYSLAKYSVFATYLRKILGYSYISNELERIADYACGIAKAFFTQNFTVKQTEILIMFWKELLHKFDEVEKIFFNKKAEDLLALIKKHQNDHLDFESFLQKKVLNANDLFTIPKQEKIVSKPNLAPFLLQFQSFRRSMAHLDNVVEYLLLIRSFVDFKNFKRESW